MDLVGVLCSLLFALGSLLSGLSCCHCLLSTVVALLFALSSLLSTAFAADKLIVKDADQNTKCVVTDEGQVGVGTTSPETTLIVTDEAGGPARGFSISQNNSGPSAAVSTFRKSRGNASAPTAVLNGDYTGALSFRNYSGSSYLRNAFVGARVNGTVTSTSVPTDIYFSTSPTDDSDSFGNGTVRLLIRSDGNVGIGATAPSQKLEVNGGMRMNTASAKPTCDTNARGTLWFTQGASGVADTLEVCAKDASDVYAWRTLW